MELAFINMRFLFLIVNMKLEKLLLTEMIFGGGKMNATV